MRSCCLVLKYMCRWPVAFGRSCVWRQDSSNHLHLPPASVPCCHPLPEQAAQQPSKHTGARLAGDQKHFPGLASPVSTLHAQATQCPAKLSHKPLLVLTAAATPSHLIYTACQAAQGSKPYPFFPRPRSRHRSAAPQGAKYTDPPPSLLPLCPSPAAPGSSSGPIGAERAGAMAAAAAAVASKLSGGSGLSLDQKKKLLWGGKKKEVAVEPAPQARRGVKGTRHLCPPCGVPAACACWARA